MTRTDGVYLFCRASSLTLRSSYFFVAFCMLALTAQLFPWYEETDDEGNTYTLNDFDVSHSIPGLLYIFLVSLQCIRWYLP